MFEERLSALDLSLFDAIPSQSTDNDRRTLLALQRAVRARAGASYVFLEIGSHLGGSLQPHVLDPKCARIYSIDRRPEWQDDERGVRFPYQGNSTTRMLANLDTLAPSASSRITTFDADASAVDPSAIDPRPHWCFIDGEHTDAAFASDFAFCRQVMPSGGLIVCHDAPIVYNAIAAAIALLEREGTPFRAAPLPDAHLVIELGDGTLLDAPELAPLHRDAFRAYLHALRENDRYREFATRPIFRALRYLRTRAGR